MFFLRISDLIQRYRFPEDHTLAKKLKQMISDAENLLHSLSDEKTTAEQQREIAAMIRRLSTWLPYMQHERLIHLIVTCLFAIVAFIVLGILLYTLQWSLAILLLLIVVLLIPYIFHYFHLENGVQRLYDLIDDLNERMEME